MAKFIQRVTAVETRPDEVSAVTIVKKNRRGKKKVSRWLRPTERVVRKYLKAEKKCWTDLSRRHGKARGKKRDRWLTDSVSNSLRSADKGCRTFGKI